jgi:hypothetical protein
MTHARDFAKAVGGQIAHVTASSNLPCIRALGLRSAAASAHAAGVAPESILLRDTRQQVGDATLNHQKPILHGINAANRIVEGHTAESWAAQLDERIFFWPRAKGEAFSKSVAKDLAIDTIWFDAEKFADALDDDIDLCALNSGNFVQGGTHAQRGDWIYTPLRDGLDAFRNNRVDRGLVKTRDKVKEVSLRSAIPPDLLQELTL